MGQPKKRQAAALPVSRLKTNLSIVIPYRLKKGIITTDKASLSVVINQIQGGINH
jgi:hypothetical protein